MKYASIDVGTNAVLLLIVEDNGEIKDIVDISTITRLGEGLKKRGCLCDEAMARTFIALENYRKIIEEKKVQEIFCVGTNALREATNADFFINMVKEKLDFTIRTISEHDEAYYTYLSIKNDALIKENDLIIIDIGGGSTEIMKGKDGEFLDFASIPLGSVKLTEIFIKNDPPLKDELSVLEKSVRNLIKLNFNGNGCALIGTGGTITCLTGILLNLETFNKEKIHAARITLSEIDIFIDLLKSMDTFQRKAIKGMENGREDILLQGIILLREIMVYLGIDNFIVSANGVRYGVIYERLGCA